MAMINYCIDCGLVIQCRNCNPICPQCGGEIIRKDYILYIQEKEKEKNREKFIGK